MIDFEAARTTMVDCQIRPSDVTLYPIIAAMLNTRREKFVPHGLRDVAYSGEALPIGPGRVVLAPRTIGKMLDALSIGPDELVLDIGSGLGYVTALVGQLAEAVVGVEELSDIAAQASSNLSDQSIDNAIIHDGVLREGDASHGPFDVVLIEGGVVELPAALDAQLKEGGRIGMIRMNGQVGQMQVGIKKAGRITWRNVFDATAPVLPGFEAEKEFSL